MPEPHSHGADGMPVYPDQADVIAGNAAVPDAAPIPELPAATIADAGKVLAVNGAGDGYELSDGSGGLVPVPTAPDALKLLRVNTDGDGYEVANVQLASLGDPLIECTLSLGALGAAAQSRLPFYGRPTDAVDDFLGFVECHSVTRTVPAATTVDVSIHQLGALITDLTTDQITAMGAAGGLGTANTAIYIDRQDAGGFAHLRALQALAPVDDPFALPFEFFGSPTGTHGVTINGSDVPVLEAGTYSITVVYSIDVWWG